MAKKSKEINVHDHDQQQQNLDPENPQSSQSSRRSCSSALSRFFGIQCVIILVLSFAILISAIFWLFPRRSLPVFDTDETVKLNASVKAYFRVQKPASEVISHKGRLELDIFQSIGLSNIKVTILSLHQSGVSNYTDVEFAVLPVPPDHALTKHSLNLLRLTFVELFTKRWNLNLTTSSFGQPTSFQVLKFPGGITVDLKGPTPVSGILEIIFIFKFTLNKSISEIQDNRALLNSQLEHVLCLVPHESVHYYKLTNKNGSTVSPPVNVRVYIVSTIRNHLQQRLDHFARIIQTSGANNLGLDNSVFGEVKSITFSTYLEGKIIDSASLLAPAPASCSSSLC